MPAMEYSRRRFLSAALGTSAWGAAVCAGALQAQRARAAEPSRTSAGRVVVVGGGWGGLSAARHLRALAPAIDVTLVERNAGFESLPLSTQWLAGSLPAETLRRDYAAAARAWGYRRVQATVQAIDRDRREVRTDAGPLPYDWLVLAAGIRHDWRAWFGDDAETAAFAAREFPCGFRPGELGALKRKLDAWRGGILLMTLPPQPSRCPPAPYERATMIAARMQREKIRGKLILLDPGPGILGFRQLFEDRYADEVRHVAHAAIRSVDPRARRVRTEFDEFAFDDAILMPPQQAADLAWDAGLIGRGEDGRPTGWAAQHPLRLHALADERIFLVGDLIGPVSPLFGHYSKNAHVAVRLGRIAAAEIAARAAGREAAMELPDSVCYVASDFDPPESLRIDTEYRLRGDGAIMQISRQHRDPQPRGEDVAWARETLAELFGS